MSEPTNSATEPKQAGWWKRRSKKAKFFLIALALLVGIIAIGSAAGGSSKKANESATGANTSEDTTPPAQSAPKAAPIVLGSWNAQCNQYSAGDLSACKGVHVNKVTCQWQGDDVHMTVVFKNTFGAHVTVHMNPIYTLRNAGLHGNGLMSVKDVGLDAGELRTVTVDENPAGVDANPRIKSCRPGVDVLGGVELG